LIASFSQFKKSNIDSNISIIKSMLLYIVLGNFFWLIAESSDVILIIKSLDSFPHLAMKYVFFVLSAIGFSGGLFVYFWDRYKMPN